MAYFYQSSDTAIILCQSNQWLLEGSSTSQSQTESLSWKQELSWRQETNHSDADGEETIQVDNIHLKSKTTLPSCVTTCGHK